MLAACALSEPGRPDASRRTPTSEAATADGLPRVVPVVAGDGIFWLGHSSFLIRRGQSAVLTDPVFTVSPDIRYGFRLKRLTPPHPGLDRLAAVTAIVISHTHADHFDVETLKALAIRFPAAELVVPAGTERTAAKAGFARVRPVELWNSVEAGGFRLTALPARHVGRKILGLYPTPAYAWEIDGAGPRIFFSGDTAYGPHFGEIRTRRGRFDVALVAVGGYGPELALNHMHMTPEQAIQAAADLDARIAIGHHWGTFPMGAEDPADMRRRFEAAARPQTRTLLLDIGGRYPLR